MNYTSRRSRRRKPISDINVVPYIDVTFVLLIIFMITAPLQQSAVDVNLPVTSSGVKVEQKEQPPVIISIQKNGQYYLNEEAEKPISLAELLSSVSTLQKNNLQTQVYIKADTAVAYGKVVSIMAVLKEAGVPHVGLMTSPSEP